MTKYEVWQEKFTQLSFSKIFACRISISFFTRVRAYLAMDLGLYICWIYYVCPLSCLVAIMLLNTNHTSFWWVPLRLLRSSAHLACSRNIKGIKESDMIKRSNIGEKRPECLNHQTVMLLSSYPRLAILCYCQSETLNAEMNIRDPIKRTEFRIIV